MKTIFAFLVLPMLTVDAEEATIVVPDNVQLVTIKSVVNNNIYEYGVLKDGNGGVTTSNGTLGVSFFTKTKSIMMAGKNTNGDLIGITVRLSEDMKTMIGFQIMVADDKKVQFWEDGKMTGELKKIDKK